jgi:hypothetical protein
MGGLPSQRRYAASGHTLAYHGSLRKREARLYIAKCWRDFTGMPSIPSDRHYYMLPGPMGHAGVLYEGSELRQLEAEGLFKASQVRCVERLCGVHDENVRAVKAHYPKDARPTMLLGDIVEQLGLALADGDLRASIVSLDTINEAVPGIDLLRRTFNFLNHIDGPTMVTWNVISARRFPRAGRYPWDVNDCDKPGLKVLSYLGRALIEHPGFLDAYRHGWDQYPEGLTTFKACRYDGSSRNGNTLMTTYVFVRRKKACVDFCRCPVLCVRRGS